MALKGRRKLFAAEFPTDRNATAAAKRAGYSERTAYSQGQRLLKNAEVQEAIQAADSARAARTGLTQDWVLERLRKEAEREGKDGSPSARVAALKLLGLHLGMWGDGELTRRIEALEKLARGESGPPQTT